MTAFAEKWGCDLESRGYTQFSNLLLRRWREIGLSRTERDNILIIISYQDNPNEKAVPSARQLAYESGCGYDTTRRNLRRLCAPVVDEAGKVVRKQLLHAVPLKNGRIRYAMTALRHALEKLDASPALAIVKPAKVRPAPKPAPIVTLYEERGIDAEMTSKLVARLEEDARAAETWRIEEAAFWAQADESPKPGERDVAAELDWDTLRGKIAKLVSPAVYLNWFRNCKALGWKDNILQIGVESSFARDHLERMYGEMVNSRLTQIYANCSVQFVLAATVGV